MKERTVFYAMNRGNHTAELLPCFKHWEEVQNAFRWGIQMSNGINADAIGRCYSIRQFRSQAAFGEWHILNETHCPGVTNLNMPVNTAWE